MWTRAMLKERAKAVLKGSYWKAFLVGLVMVVAGGQSGGGISLNFGGLPFGGGDNQGRGGFDWSSEGTSGLGGGVEFLALFIAIFAVIFLVVLAFVLAYRIFLGFPIEVSSRQYYKQASLGDVNLNYLGHVFNRIAYWPIIKAMLLRGVYTFLWTLLLVIPGIVKSYAYSMVPYLLADNPHIGTSRAIELSERMCKGQKWRMFVLDLSFIGWFLLGLLACGVGVLFVQPYVNQTKAELYLTLRQDALEQGMTTPEELRLA
ncbi:DUF975 family protein [Paenibacillus chartarius]|uniref:DUF975 family protein n=1 Tax=Paenibacillus chartarius TaxID=747481 RepID=A0ABV6DSM6_9BACL